MYRGSQRARSLGEFIKRVVREVESVAVFLNCPEPQRSHQLPARTFSPFYLSSRERIRWEINIKKRQMATTIRSLVTRRTLVITVDLWYIQDSLNFREKK